MHAVEKRSPPAAVWGMGVFWSICTMQIKKNCRKKLSSHLGFNQRETKPTNRHTNKQTNNQTNKPASKPANKQTQTNEQTSKQASRKANQPTNQPTKKKRNKHSRSCKPIVAKSCLGPKRNDRARATAMNTLHELSYDEVGQPSGAHSALHDGAIWAVKTLKRLLQVCA